MNIDSLKIFCDVAKMRSFSRAAQVNNVAQSTASQAVAQIEKQMGAKLVDRSTRPLKLTAKGKAFHEECLALVERYFSVENQVREIGHASAPTLNIASMYAALYCNLAPAILQLKHEMQKVHISFRYINLHAQVVDLIRSGDADMAIMTYGKETEELSIIPWIEDPIRLVCDPKHPLARRDTIEVKDLEHFDFFNFHEFMEIHRHVNGYLHSRHITVNTVQSFRALEVMKSKLQGSDAFALLPSQHVLSEIQAGLLVSPPVEDLDLKRSMDIVVRRNHPMSNLTKRMIELLQEQVPEYTRIAPSKTFALN